VLDHPAAAWIVAQVPRGRRVVRAQRLMGGLTSEVTAVTVEDAHGKPHRFVLRRWTAKPWPDGAVDDGRLLVPREAATLLALETVALAAPRVVATDPTGDEAGLPALLMTRLPGRIDLNPAAPDDWIRQLAEQLAEIHDIAPWPGLPAYETWLRVPEPLAASRPEPAVARLVHHDYQQFNVLWSRGRISGPTMSGPVISGVVDWVWASSGPADDDVVHCRGNLCLLYGADRAIAFQSAYEALVGRRVDPWWDLAGALDGLGWQRAELQKQAGRRLRVPAQATMRAELDRLVARARADH
jgi:aminoglycoside phosphotransferase (APT) family kinase protein